MSRTAVAITWLKRIRADLSADIFCFQASERDNFIFLGYGAVCTVLALSDVVTCAVCVRHAEVGMYHNSRPQGIMLKYGGTCDISHQQTLDRPEAVLV